VTTPRDYEGSLAAIAELVALIERTVGERGTVGIGIPGMISQRTGVVKNANSTWLIGKPLGAVLEERLGRPVRLMNDANCFALSEATDGAGAGFDCVFGVILGTGVGGGITIGRRVHVGANLIGGEWGHNPLPWPDGAELPGPACYCGKRGCIETFLSGPGLAADYHRQTSTDATGEDVVRRERPTRDLRHDDPEHEARRRRPGVDPDERRRVARGVAQRLGPRVPLGLRRGRLVVPATEQNHRHDDRDDRRRRHPDERDDPPGHRRKGSPHRAPCSRYALGSTAR